MNNYRIPIWFLLCALVAHLFGDSLLEIAALTSAHLLVVVLFYLEKILEKLNNESS